MTQSPDAGSASERTEALEAEILDFARQKERCAAREREFRAKEDLAAGLTFHAEIFELQQDRLRLEVEIQLRRARLKRIKLGLPEQGPPQGGPDNGFLF
ncbi:MAG: hypothetical protein JW718_00980 [Desulfovibrionaceae bacterium]|nr:hypothetical protein [Desulfovibrionaceae bacterium]